MLSRLLSCGAVLATLVTAAPAVAQSGADESRFAQAQARYDREYQIYRQEVDRYRSARGRGGYSTPPYDGNYRRAPDAYGYEDDDVVYDPQRDYRSDGTYRERTVAPSERVYAGYDGRYYCKRSDGTTGLIVGGAAGGILGNVIDGGRSRVLGTLLGGAAGALAGKSIEQNQQQVRCR